MNDLTFLMPCKIESEDRLRNVVTSTTYLLKNFPESNLIIKEVDATSNFKEKALPIIEKYVTTDKLTHIFEKSDNNFFHKTKILNDLLVASKTDIVYNHDVDVILPIGSYTGAYNAIKKHDIDVVYPFGCGVYQWAVNYSQECFEQFLDSEFNFDILTPNRFRVASSIGWGQMIKRQSEIECYMWNENFISWGAEDCEFYFRLSSLGFKIGRINSDIYHFEHMRTHNSHYHNPKFMDNHNLWQSIRTWDINKITEYYSSQKYVKLRRRELNVSV